MSNEIVNASNGGLPANTSNDRGKGVSEGHGRDRSNERANAIRNRRPQNGMKMGTMAKNGLVNLTQQFGQTSGDLTQRDASQILDPFSDMATAGQTAMMSFSAGFSMGWDVDKKIQGGKDLAASYGRDKTTRRRGVQGEYSKDQKEAQDSGDQIRKNTKAGMKGKVGKAAGVAALVTAGTGALYYFFGREGEQQESDDISQKIVDTANISENIKTTMGQSPSKTNSLTEIIERD